MFTGRNTWRLLPVCLLAATLLISPTAVAQPRTIEQQRHFEQFKQQYDLVQAMKARAAWQATPVYDPWLQGYTSPFLRRGIWGYGYYDGARQSIGQHQVQTAPDRWESYPVYPEDLQPQPSYAIPPTIAAPQPFAPHASPAPEPAVRGVRGF